MSDKTLEETVVEDNTNEVEEHDDQKERFAQALDSITKPKLPGYDIAQELQYNISSNDEQHILIDEDDMSKVNNTINSIRIALFRVSKGIDNAERNEKKAKTAYD